MNSKLVDASMESKNNKHETMIVAPRRTIDVR
jgi:hypothetical protein